MKRAVVITVALAAALLAGCNSTTRLHSRDAGLGTGSKSSSGATSVDSTVPDNASGAAGGASTGSASGSSGGSGSGRSRAGGGGGAALAAAPRTPTRGTVKIGFGYPNNLSAAYAAFGANNLTGDDWKTYIEPIVAWMNAHGGLAGRAIVPVYHGTDPTNGTFQAQAEAECAAFTQDDHVFAVVGEIIADNQADCYAHANTPFLAQTAVLVDHTMYDRHPGLVYQPFMITAERQAVWIDSLVTQRYFTSGSRVGLLEMDNSVYHRFADTVIKPRLAAHGIQLADEFAFTPPDSAAGAGSLFAQANNAVLRFRAENITHVILSPSGGAIPFVFMQSAESQGYRPRYALNSLEVPAFVTQNVPVAQLTGSLGVGWLPASDLYYKEVVHGANPAEDLCFAITKRNGDEVKRYCDGLFFLAAALQRAPEFSAAGLRAGVEALGTSYDSPWTFATRFGPGRYDGARQVRPLAFVDACSCYRYTGPPVDVP
jgi:hypothetical protein